jgi:hypothetical protein
VIAVDLEAEEFAVGMVGGELSEMMRVKCWTFPRTTSTSSPRAWKERTPRFGPRERKASLGPRGTRASTGEGRGMPVSVREVVSQINWGGTRRRGKDSVGFEGLRPKSF